MSTSGTGAPAGAQRDTRIPVHILTGFLGSGKTTLLRHLLASEDLADTAVIINEFGEVGLDHLLVRELAEDVVLLSSGCLCCSVKDDLVSTLADLHALKQAGEIPAFSRVVVETTGLADPAPIMQAVLGEKRLAMQFRLGNVVTTIDAVNGLVTLDGHREARSQLANADRLIVTKTDLVPADYSQLVKKLQSTNPSARLLFSARPQIPANLILGEAEGDRVAPRMLQLADNDRAPFGPVQHPGLHGDSIGTFTVKLEHAIDWAAFVDWLELLLASRGDSILRVKGLIAVHGDDRPVVVQGVQHVLYPIEHLPAWPDPAQYPGWMIFIARDLTPRAIQDSLASLHEQSLV
jgi:G3E family GTPase